MSTPDPRPPISTQQVQRAVDLASASARLDPTTPGPQAKPTALSAAATSALAGTPTAVGIVWILSTYGHVTDPVAASAIGATAASVAGYLWRVFQALLGKWGIDPGDSP